jgi:hypothetical protein
MGKSRKIKIKTPYFSKCTYLVDLDVNGKIYLSKQWSPKWSLKVKDSESFAKNRGIILLFTFSYKRHY